MTRHAQPPVLSSIVLALCVAGTGAVAVAAQQSGSGPEPAQPTPAQRQAAEDAPLFASHAIVEMRLRTDVDRLKDERPEEEQPGELSYALADGDTVRLEVEVRARGNFRRDERNCTFPPLRIDVRTSRAAGTLLEGEDKLKLVTPCNERRGDYERYVLREYLAYRMFNELTPWSFRVRLLRMTYEDTSGEHDPRTLFAFLLEDEERMAQRLGGVAHEIAQLHPTSTDAEYSTLVALFQLMIANTDWSSVAFHNTVAIRVGQGRFLTVPYDFDFSGLVDARYASPDPSLDIDDVTERVYRGFCRDDVDVRAVADRVRGRRAAIEAVVAGFSSLDEGGREDVLEYLEDFWRTLEDPSRFDRMVVRGCRSLS